jgi:prepilin-type N-terminal cleavage/methylation domain-containing protein
MRGRGFTLIELLVVIAVLGVLAAAIVVAINPVQKINQANDAKVKNDVAQIATAEQSYYTRNQYYTGGGTAVQDLVNAGELTIQPVAPNGYSAYTIQVNPAGCTTALKTCTSITVVGDVKAPATSGNTKWCFHTSTGVAAEGTAATCVAP